MNIDFKKITKGHWGIALALLGAIFITDFLLLQNIINIAFPIGDEFSLIVESQKTPISWIKAGYSNYFRVYDEYFLPYTNFIRPVANFLYKLFSYTPDPFIYQLVTVNYLVHSLICAVVYVISIALNNTNRFSLALATAAFLVPAFWLTPMISHPSFALDGLAAFFCLISLVALLKNRLNWGLIFLIGGLFTKETALPMSIVWVLVGIQRKNSRVIGFGLLALCLWLFARVFAYNSFTGGTYSFNELSIQSLLLRASSLATLPVGNFSFESLKDLITNHKVSTELFYLAANFTAWILSLKVFLKSKPEMFNPRQFFKDSDNLTVIFIALVGSVLFYVLIGGSVRFSYLTYTLWLIALCGVSGSTARSLVVSLLISSSFISFLKMNEVSEVKKFIYGQSRLFVNYLGEHQLSGETYVFNDFIGAYSRQQNIAIYSGSTSKFLRGSSISLDSCDISMLRLIRTSVVIDETGNKFITTDIPSCASFVFEGASQKKLIENIKGSTLRRNDHIYYKFKNLEITKSRFTGNTQISFGKHVEIFVSSKVNALYYDFYDNKWVLTDKVYY
jgi:hypothetical protein